MENACGKDKVIIVVMVGTRTEENLRRKIGIRLRLHCLFGKDCRHLNDSSTVARVKQGKLERGSDRGW